MLVELELLQKRFKFPRGLKTQGSNCRWFTRSSCVDLLPVQFDQLKVTYKAQQDKRNNNRLIFIRVQEEGRINHSKISVHLTVEAKPTKSQNNKTNAEIPKEFRSGEDSRWT